MKTLKSSIERYNSEKPVDLYRIIQILITFDFVKLMSNLLKENQHTDLPKMKVNEITNVLTRLKVNNSFS